MYVCDYVHVYTSMYLCMHVCAYECMYVCMYICTYTYICVCVCVCVYECMCVRIYVCRYVHIYACMYICMCMYMCIQVCVCMRVCMWVCVYVCIMYVCIMYLCMYACAYECIYVRMYIYICVYICMYVCMCICMHGYLIICLRMRVFFVCMSVQSEQYVLCTYTKSVMNSIWCGENPRPETGNWPANSCHIVQHTPPLPIITLSASCAANWLQPAISTSTCRKHNVFQIPEIVLYLWRLIGFYCGVAAARFVTSLFRKA